MHMILLSPEGVGEYSLHCAHQLSLSPLDDQNSLLHMIPVQCDPGLVHRLQLKASTVDL